MLSFERQYGAEATSQLLVCQPSWQSVTSWNRSLKYAKHIILHWLKSEIKFIASIVIEAAADAATVLKA